MPLPAPEPTTRDLVKVWASISDDTDDDAIDSVVAAVNALIRGLPVAGSSNTDPAPEDWPNDIKFGAMLLAARLWRRRNTPGGVEAAGDFGIAYVRRNDPDIAQMLQLGEYAPPRVG